MHNAIIKQFGSTTVIKYFKDKVFYSSPPRKSHPKLYEVPWEDEFGNPIFVPELPSDEDIAYKKRESVRCSVSRTRNKLIDICRSGNFQYMFTLTFDPKKIDSMNYATVTKAVSGFFKELRRLYPHCQYVAVAEKHKSGAYHFHGLISADINLLYAGFYHRQHVYHFPIYTYGYTDVTRIKSSERAVSYILKYISKDLCAVTSGKRRYWYSYSTIGKPVVYKSLITPDNILTLMKGNQVYAFNSFFPYYQIILKSEKHCPIYDFVRSISWMFSTS